MGGIESGADALAFLAAGATAVAVGTANFRDPLAGNRVREELAAGLREAGADAPSERAGPNRGVDLNLRSNEISPRTAADPPCVAREGGYMIAAADGPLRRHRRRRSRENP